MALTKSKSRMDGDLYDTVSALTASSASAGSIVHTKGYTTVDDGGKATYIIKTAAEFGGVPDEAKDHTLANGNVAVLHHNDIIINKQVGAANTYVGFNIDTPIARVHSYSTGLIPSFLSEGGGADYCVKDGEFMQFGHWDGAVFDEDMRIETNGRIKAPLVGKAFIPFTTTTAVSKGLSNGEVCAVTISGRILTLPASPEVGDHVTVLVGNFADTTIKRNASGENIMALAEDMIIDVAYSSVRLVYTDATYGWRVN